MHNPSTAAPNGSRRAAEYPETQMTHQTNESSDKRVKLWETLRPCEKCDCISERGSGPLALVASALLLATAWFIIALSEKRKKAAASNSNTGKFPIHISPPCPVESRSQHIFLLFATAALLLLLLLSWDDFRHVTVILVMYFSKVTAKGPALECEFVPNLPVLNIR